MTARSENPEQTLKIARRFGATLSRGSLVLLRGPLGSGKTVFAKGVAKSLGIDEPVTSPTFTIVNEYAGVVPLLHIDLYRIDSGEEYVLLGVDERFPASVVLVEWPERAEGALPKATHSVEIKLLSTSSREILITTLKDNDS